MRVLRLLFRNGSAPRKPVLDVVTNNITVLVGPNDSGKSQTLREIDAFYDRDKPKVFKVLDKIDIQVPSSKQEITALLEPFNPQKEEADSVLRISRPNLYGSGGPNDFAYRATEIESLFSGRIDEMRSRGLLRLFCIMLDGRGRLEIAGERERGDLLRPGNYLSKLYRADSERERLRRIIKDEFNIYLYLDASGHNMKIRMSKTPFANERSLDETALSFLQSCPTIDDFGDGVRAFVGLLIGVLTLPHKVMLIDEPEAFLHPPASRTLGKYLSTFAKERNASMVIATHSADFLMGCLETTQQVNIIRLTYDREQGTARQLTSTEVEVLMKDALLRSADTMDALFHRATIVCESDSDRAFYAEINYHLRNENKGIRDALFLNAQGKHTVHRIAISLRKIGVPAACIYDLDILDETKDENEGIFQRVMKDANVPPAELQRLEAERSLVEAALNSIPKGGPNPWKRGGILHLTGSQKQLAEKLLADLKLYGLYIVPSGELEQWLLPLGISSTDKRQWLVAMLDRLSNDDIKVGAGDVWDFINGIDSWISNSKREGMPF